jgi:hypothetical protein
MEYIEHTLKSLKTVSKSVYDFFPKELTFWSVLFYFFLFYFVLFLFLKLYFYIYDLEFEIDCEKSYNCVVTKEKQ